MIILGFGLIILSILLFFVLSAASKSREEVEKRLKYSAITFIMGIAFIIIAACTDDTDYGYTDTEKKVLEDRANDIYDTYEDGLREQEEEDFNNRK